MSPSSCAKVPIRSFSCVSRQSTNGARYCKRFCGQRSALIAMIRDSGGRDPWLACSRSPFSWVPSRLEARKEVDPRNPTSGVRPPARIQCAIEKKHRVEPAADKKGLILASVDLEPGILVKAQRRRVRLDHRNPDAPQAANPARRLNGAAKQRAGDAPPPHPRIHVHADNLGLVPLLSPLGADQAQNADEPLGHKRAERPPVAHALQAALEHLGRPPRLLCVGASKRLGALAEAAQADAAIGRGVRRREAPNAHVTPAQRPNGPRPFAFVMAVRSPPRTQRPRVAAERGRLTSRQSRSTR